jgi:hypothetical protein
MTPSACPCEVSPHPRVPFNPPGRAHITYRHGDFASFRHALLLPLPGERQLTLWRPTAGQDLALQMVEWWAYLADVLTFYNERIANQAYLRTADLPESLDRLVRLLGYRPRPGIGATGTVAALLGGVGPVSVPAGFQIQSKPGPGKQPQTFEVDATTELATPAAVAAVPKPDGLLVTSVAGVDTILLAGTVTTVRVDDELLLLSRAGGESKGPFTVTAVTPDPDPAGGSNTRVAFSKPLGPGLGGALASDYRVVKSSQSAKPWPYPTDPNVVITATEIALDSVARQLVVGEPVLLEVTSDTPPAPKPVTATGYTEVVWFANGKPNNPANPPTPPDVPIPILHALVSFKKDEAAGFDAKRSAMVVRFGWQDVGRAIASPVTTVPAAATELTIVPAGPERFPPPAAGMPMLLEDAAGAGLRAFASGVPDAIALSGLSARSVALRSPLNALFALLPVSRGTTVRDEVLGGGSAGVAGQEFILQKAPLTYLADPDPSALGGYVSTLQVFVDGVRWTEAPSFYGQPPDAHVFVTREGLDGKTRVQFGDGVNGARLPSGTGNVVASYRYGSGAEAPAAGSLTVVAKPLPRIKGIRNPVAVGGGSDPDPPDQLRRYAPRSILTFGRAVSADDYEAIAATAPGVARARSYWSFDPGEQRAMVTLYVGDDEAAVPAARTALAAADDPNRPVDVRLATVIPVTLDLTLALDRRRVPEQVVAAVTAALVDPDTGLFGQHTVRIGQSVYTSAINAACIDTPGVVAVHGLVLQADRGAGPQPEPGPRFDPGEGAFFRLPPTELTIHQAAAT